MRANNAGVTSLSEPSSQLAPVLELLSDVETPGAWRKCIVTPARQARPFVPWEKLVAEPVRLARRTAVKVVVREDGKESTATLTPEQWSRRLHEAIDIGPCHLDVLARDHDWHARRTRAGHWLVTRAKPSLPQPAGASVEIAGHNRVRQYPLAPNNERVRQLFIEAGIYGKNGHLLGESAAKYRQVQHYIELLRHLPAWEAPTVRIVDAGCGKAYLSLALCLWAELNGKEVHLVGVDSSAEVVETASRIAARSGLQNAEFRASTVAEFTEEARDPVDLLLSLHACDTATDEALAAGVRLNAGAIVLVPCCHQELSDQLQANTKAGSSPGIERWGATLRSGLLQHRLADIITDSLRAEALEALGYQVDVIEFVSPEATAKNLMIRATRRGESLVAAPAAMARYRALADEWGVAPALEGLLGSSWPPNAD